MTETPQVEVTVRNEAETIEAIADARADAVEAETEARKEIIEAEAEAQAVIIDAQAQADVARIEASSTSREELEQWRNGLTELQTQVAVLAEGMITLQTEISQLKVLIPQALLIAVQMETGNNSIPQSTLLETENPSLQQVEDSDANEEAPVKAKVRERRETYL